METWKVGQLFLKMNPCDGKKNDQNRSYFDFLVIESFEVFYICLLEFQLIRKDDREKAENTY